MFIPPVSSFPILFKNFIPFLSRAAGWRTFGGAPSCRTKKESALRASPAPPAKDVCAERTHLKSLPSFSLTVFRLAHKCRTTSYASLHFALCTLHFQNRICAKCILNRINASAHQPVFRNKKARNLSISSFSLGDPEGIRTPDTLIRRPAKGKSPCFPYTKNGVN